MNTTKNNKIQLITTDLYKLYNKIGIKKVVLTIKATLYFSLLFYSTIPIRFGLVI